MISYVTASTEYGLVKGVKKTTVLDCVYNAFLGIPYAKPPVGDRRFKAPVKPDKWNGVYDASVEAPGSMELNSIQKKIIGSEDSLYVKIFSKELKPKKLQPVMFYIYGGGFRTGSSSMAYYSPDYLLMADVVVVTFNYRSGALGFLGLHDKALDIPGNAGSKDQLMALKFVKKNIQNFGGDPDNITIFGHSSGSTHVNWHCFSESSKNLFNRAIILAGSIVGSQTLTAQGEFALELAKKLGYEGSENEKEVLSFLRAVDAEKIIEIQGGIASPGGFSFVPSIETFVDDNTFISKPASELLKTAWSNDIDLMIESAADEGALFYDECKNNPSAHLNPKVVLPREIEASHDDPAVLKFLQRLKEVYYDTDEVDMFQVRPATNAITKEQLAHGKLRSDQIFWLCFQRHVQSRLNAGGKGKSFLSRFGVDSPTQNSYRNRWHRPGSTGIGHADEINYMFKNMVDLPPRDSMEFRAIQRFVSMLTSFATCGDPSANVTKADMQNIKAKPVDSLEPPFKGIMIGNDDIKFDYIPVFERLKVWSQLFKDTNTPLF